jgi:hypothetical protein
MRTLRTTLVSPYNKLLLISSLRFMHNINEKWPFPIRVIFLGFTSMSGYGYSSNPIISAEIDIYIWWLSLKGTLHSFFPLFCTNEILMTRLPSLKSSLEQTISGIWTFCLSCTVIRKAPRTNRHSIPYPVKSYYLGVLARILNSYVFFP